MIRLTTVIRDPVNLQIINQQAKTKAERGKIIGDIELKSIKFGMLIQIYNVTIKQRPPRKRYDDSALCISRPRGTCKEIDNDKSDLPRHGKQ